MRDVEKLAAPLAAPAVHLVPADGPTRSHWGGSPQLPSGVNWPERNGSKLAFLARVSLAELHRVHRVSWLPETGALLFFYDMDAQPWGFDPNDRGSCAVLHVADLDTPALPAGENDSIAPVSMEFRRIDPLPSHEREAFAGLDLDDKEFDEYVELSEAVFDGMPKHQMGGLPDAVQADQMELECQLVTSGLYLGDPAGYQDPRVKTLAPGAKEWRLLLQLDSDEDHGMMWGDMGKLYFWVRESEAAAGRFDNVWLILQSG